MRGHNGPVASLLTELTVAIAIFKEQLKTTQLLQAVYCQQLVVTVQTFSPLYFQRFKPWPYFTNCTFNVG